MVSLHWTMDICEKNKSPNSVVLLHKKCALQMSYVHNLVHKNQLVIYNSPDCRHRVRVCVCAKIAI